MHAHNVAMIIFTQEDFIWWQGNGNNRESHPTRESKHSSSRRCCSNTGTEAQLVITPLLMLQWISVLLTRHMYTHIQEQP